MPHEIYETPPEIVPLKNWVIHKGPKCGRRSKKLEVPPNLARQKFCRKQKNGFQHQIEFWQENWKFKEIQKLTDDHILADLELILTKSCIKTFFKDPMKYLKISLLKDINCVAQMANWSMMFEHEWIFIQNPLKLPMENHLKNSIILWTF